MRDWAGDEPSRLGWITDCIARHHRHDWGDVDRHDWALNDRAIACRSGRLLSAYDPTAELGAPERLWVITDDLEDPDTATTNLWPANY